MSNFLEEVHLEIKNMYEYTKRKDYDQKKWFAFSVDTLVHPDFLDISGDEFKVFCWILSIGYKCGAGTLRLHVRHAAAMLRTNEAVIFSCLEKLNGKRWILLDKNGLVTDPLRNRTLSVPREDKIREDKKRKEKNNTFSAEPLNFESPATQTHHKKSGLKNIPLRLNSLSEIENVLGAELMGTFLEIYKNKEFIEKEFMKSLAWLQSNPNKGYRTVRGWRQFYTSWLNRANDIASKVGPSNRPARLDVLSVELKKG